MAALRRRVVVGGRLRLRRDLSIIGSLRLAHTARSELSRSAFGLGCDAGGMRLLTRSVTAAAAAACATTAVLLLAGPVDASCDGPTLRVTPARGAAGSTVTVSGEGYAATCNDTGTVGQPIPRAAPDAPRLLFKQGAREVELAAHVMATGNDYRIERRVTIPRWARPGPARILANGAAGSIAVAFTVTGVRRELPNTGRPVTPLAAAAGALVVAGAALVALSTRRTPNA